MYLSLRNFGDGFLLIRFLVWFETSFLSSKRIPYKYLVYSGKVSHLSDAYEFLHEFSGNANRLLEIPVNKCKPKGIVITKKCINMHF